VDFAFKKKEKEMFQGLARENMEMFSTLLFLGNGLTCVFSLSYCSSIKERLFVLWILVLPAVLNSYENYLKRLLADKKDTIKKRNQKTPLVIDYIPEITIDLR